MGYPPRPDPAREPSQYARWLRLASIPVTIIRSKLPPQTLDRRFGKVKNSNSWAGYALGPKACNIWLLCSFFDRIQGWWTVPTVWTPSSGNEGKTAVWVGLDGGPGSSGDVLQTGTTSEAWQSCFWWCVGVTNYLSWTEWWPGDPHPTSISVNPGDEVLAEAWYPGSGTNGYLYLHNITQNIAKTFTEPMPKAYGVTFFSGDTAEWILERPAKDRWGNLYPLAPFHWVGMSDAWAFDPNYGSQGVGSWDVQYNMRPSSWTDYYNVTPGPITNASFYWTCAIPSWSGDKSC